MIRTAAREGPQRHASKEARPGRLGRVLSSRQFWQAALGEESG